MKRQAKQFGAPVTPFTLWWELVLKTSEMLISSSQVIAHRTSRMARVGAHPDARDRQEFLLMGSEKIAAGVESAQAMTMRMLQLNQQMGTIAFNRIVAGCTGIMSVAAARTAAQLSKAQSEVFRETIYGTSKASSQLAGSVARVAQHGLKPIHSLATANARRLSKYKK